MTRHAQGDDAWLNARLGAALADALWPYLQLAEARRLSRVYGYLKDNAIPAPLPQRLRDSTFVADLREAIFDDDELDDAAHLLDAVDRLT